MIQEYKDNCEELVAKLEGEVRDLQEKSYMPKIAAKIQFRQQQIAKAREGIVLYDPDDVKYCLNHSSVISEAAKYSRTQLTIDSTDFSHGN